MHVPVLVFRFFGNVYVGVSIYDIGFSIVEIASYILVSVYLIVHISPVERFAPRSRVSRSAAYNCTCGSDCWGFSCFSVLVSRSPYLRATRFAVFRVCGMNELMCDAVTETSASFSFTLTTRMMIS